MGGETDILKKSTKRWKPAAKKDLLQRPAKVRDLRVCPFSLRQTLSRMIAVQYLQNLHLNNLYTLYNNWRQNYSFYKKRSAQWHSKWQYKLWNQLNPVPFRPMRLSNPKLVHSIMPLSLFLPRSHYDLYLIDFHYLYIFFPCIFYSVFCFRTWHFLLSDLPLLLSLSRSALFSGLGFWNACYRHVSFLHCKCLRTHTHYWWYSAYGFLICNRDVFTRQ